MHTYLISEAERDLAGKLPPPIVCGYNRNENIEKVLPSCVPLKENFGILPSCYLAAFSGPCCLGKKEKKRQFHYILKAFPS